MRAACQAATFFFLARHFEAVIYGQFVVLVCIGVLLAPLATAGAEYVTVAMVATRRVTTAQCLGNGLSVLGVLAPFGILLGIAYAVVVVDSGIRVSTAALFLVSEVLFIPAIELAWRAYQAHERMLMVSMLRALPAVLRLGAASVLVAGFFGTSITHWALNYSAASLIAALVATGLIKRDFGISWPSRRGSLTAVREGWSFAGYSVAERATNDFDKLLLASLGDSRAAGLYAAAYRLVEVLVMPVMAGLMTGHAGIYRAGATSWLALWRMLFRLALPIGLYGAASAAVLVAGADLFVALLGSSYAGSAEPLRVLAALPLLYGWRVLLGFGLAAAGRQTARMLVQAAAASLSLCLCLVLIPREGLLGAAIATLATEILTIIALLVLLLHTHRRSEERCMV